MATEGITRDPLDCRGAPRFATPADRGRPTPLEVTRDRSLRALTLIAILLATGAAQAATAGGGATWHDVKCVRYGKAWTQALAHLGTDGLSPAFLDRHAAFLASDCTTRADVCPRSPEELKLANIMVVLSMNAGTASTFPPFGCPK